jgi:hypothetical protein
MKTPGLVKAYQRFPALAGTGDLARIMAVPETKKLAIGRGTADTFYAGNIANQEGKVKREDLSWK